MIDTLIWFIKNKSKYTFEISAISKLIIEKVPSRQLNIIVKLDRLCILTNYSLLDFTSFGFFYKKAFCKSNFVSSFVWYYLSLQGAILSSLSDWVIFKRAVCKLAADNGDVFYQIIGSLLPSEGCLCRNAGTFTCWQ